jgi:hypothetical protein
MSELRLLVTFASLATSLFAMIAAPLCLRAAMAAVVLAAVHRSLN